MPYIGNSHNNVGEHVNNFKVLDDISSYTATFDGSAAGVVSTTNETIRVADHRFLQGQRVTYNNGGGSNIGGLTSGTAYYISLDTANTVKLATSLVNANNNTVINLSSVGSGSSHSLTAAFDGVNKEFKLTYGTKAAIVLTAPQLNIAINNVIQRPNLNPLSFTEGFAVKDGNKIIFQSAPQVNDVFWGSITSNSISVFDVEDNAVDNFTGDGSTTNFTLSAIPPNKESILVTLDGVVQYPSDNSTTRAYTIDASVVVFTSAPASGVLIQVRHIGFASPTTPVRSFYGRTGNVTLNNTDDIVTRNINSSGIITASSFSGSFSGAISGTSATFSGDVSIGGTLTYEDVKNVDSVGFITARSGILVQDDATFTGAVGNMVFDKSDSALEFGDNLKASFGNSSDLQIFHDGSNAVLQNNTGTTFIIDDRVDFQSSPGAARNLSVDGLNVRLPRDNAILSLGASDDLKLIHNGTDTFIDNNRGDFYLQTTSSGDDIILQSKDDVEIQVNGGASAIYAEGGGSVYVKWNNINRIITTSAGVSITNDLDVDGHTNLDNVSIAGVTTATGNITISSSHPKLLLIDNSNPDFSVHVNDSAFHIRNETVNRNDFRITSDGTNELYYGGNKKFETTNTGAVVTGILTATTSFVTTGNVVANGTMTVGSYGLFGSLVANDPGSNYYGTTNRFGGGVSISGALNIDGDIGHIGDTNTKIRFPAADTFSVETGGTQGVRLTSAQKLLVGDHTVSRSVGYSEHIIQTEGSGAGENGISIYATNSSAHAGHFTFGKSRNNSSVADNDYLGHILWAAHDGTDVDNFAARITGRIDGTVSSNVTPGSLEFYTVSAGSNSLGGTPRLVIDSSGHIVPGVDSTYDLGLTGTRFRNVYADTLYGDGSNLTGITQTTINSNADNRVITGSGTANTLNAESTLTYNASVLNVISTTQGLGLNLRNTGNEYTRIKFDAARTSASSALGILEGIWNNGNSVCQIYLQSGDDTTNKDDGRISMVVNSAAGSNKTAFRIEPDASVQLPNDSQKLQFGNDQDLSIWHGGSNGYIDNETGSLVFRTTSSNTERFKIDSNGNLQHTSASGVSYFQGSSEYIFGSQYSSPPAGGVESKFQVHENKTRVTLSLNAYMNNAGAPMLQFVSSRSGTKGVLGTKSAQNDYHGDIRFMGDNGTNNNTLVQSGQILVRQTTTISDGDTVCGGEMQFWTGSATGGSILQRLQIDRNGRLTLSNSEGILLSAKASSLYSLDGTLSYYATNNAVYLNGAGASGWLRLNASGVSNSRTCIDIYGQSHSSADIILFKTNSGERMRILQNGQVEVKADEGIFLKPVTNGGGSNVNGARIRFSDNSGASHNQIGEFRYKHSDSSVVSAAQNDGVNSNDAFHLFGSETLTVFRIDANTHIYNDYGLWIKTLTQGGLSSNGARIRFSSNPSTNYNQIGEISYLHDDNGITQGFVDGFRIKGSDGQANQQYGAQRTIVKVNGSLQATGNVWGVGSVCQIVRGTDQIVNNQNPPQSPAEIASGFRTSITLRTVNPYIKVTFYANPELDGASMRSAIYFYYSKNSGSYGTFQRPVWFGATTDSGNQQGGYSMLGVVGQVTGNRGDTFTFTPYWSEESNSTANYMFGQTWTQWGTMASFMYLEEIATQ